jgi:hypothetical protein
MCAPANPEPVAVPAPASVQINVVVDGGVVASTFSAAITMLRMTPQQALDYGLLLVRCAAGASSNILVAERLAGMPQNGAVKDKARKP